jgi:Flp pilus assembly protein TadG
MNRHAPALTGNRRGVAAVEFAIIAPVLLLLLGGVVDFGLALATRSQLANGVAQGVQYALLTGPSVTGTSVQSVVRAAALRSGVTGTVTVTTTDSSAAHHAGPACYCVGGEPATLSAYATMSGTYTCTGTCPSPDMAPGVFLVITASYVYQPLMPLSQLVTPTLSETVTVRLQ